MFNIDREELTKKELASGFVESTTVIIAVLLGGSVATNLPPELLTLFKTPIGEFIAFFMIFIVMYRHSNVSLIDIIIESIYGVVVLQLIKYVFLF